MELNILVMVVEVAIGFVIYYMQKSHDATRDRLTKLETDIGKALLKEDFREFKEELFKRLDRIESKQHG